MKLEVEIISREHIRPSFPTPPHLRTFKLSLLDQLIPSPYAPIILFYPSPDSTTLSEAPKRLKLLKQSLSETLTKFYPLGGKIKDEFSIDCNDEGANFIEARVKNCSVSEFLSQPNLALLYKFLPSELLTSQGSNIGTYVTNVQVNLFDCGGIAIGTCISHRILDGSALSTFLKCWSERTNNKDCINFTTPNFIASSLFPTNSLWLRDLSMSMWGSLFKQGKWITRRFLFTNSAISKIKAQITEKLPFYAAKDPTRLEIVSAALWKHLMDVSKSQFGVYRDSIVTHLVNLRRRMDEARCPNHSMGNLLWLVSAEQMNQNDMELDLDELVGKLRNSISRIDKDFVEKLQGDEGSSIMKESLREICETLSKNEVEHFGFSSWCNLGFYDADFGWGKPIWVSSIASNGTVFMNLIILVDTRLRDGIEAWVTLDEDYMNNLIANPEFLTYVTLDPSPLGKVSN